MNPKFNSISEKIYITIVLFIIALLVIWCIYNLIENKAPSLNTIKDVIGILSTLFATTIAIILFQNWKDQERYNEIKEIKKIIISNNIVCLQKKNRIEKFLTELSLCNLLIIPSKYHENLPFLSNYEKNLSMTVMLSDHYRDDDFKINYKKFSENSFKYNDLIKKTYSIFYNYFEMSSLLQEMKDAELGVFLKNSNPLTFHMTDLEKKPNLKNINNESFQKLNLFLEDHFNLIQKQYEIYNVEYEKYLFYLESLD